MEMTKADHLKKENKKKIIAKVKQKLKILLMKKKKKVNLKVVKAVAVGMINGMPIIHGKLVENQNR